MSKVCPNCRRLIDERSTVCPFCGYHLIPQQPPQQPFVPQQPQYPTPYPPQQQYPTVPPVSPVPPVAYTKPPKQKKPKKKRKMPGILKFLMVLIIIAGVLFGSWYAFGNMLTLYFHSQDVVDTLNSGSLELAGTQSAYDELPNYIKEMLGEEEPQDDFGPVTKAVLPYISVKRTKINGFLTNSTVTYEITAPDLENWLLNLEPGSFSDENELLALMTEYIETAPDRTVEVEVQYDHDGIFDFEWRGNYYTREFSDAICGGLNSAYNVIYEQAMDEIEEALKNAGQEVAE